MTHDYTVSEWGHNYHITSIRDGGNSVSLTGWGRGLKKGDYLILRNGKDDTTRYEISSVKYFSDPDDMWSVDYSKLVPMMIKEIQDLKAEVAALKGA